MTKQCNHVKEFNKYRPMTVLRDINKEIIVLKGILAGIAIDDIINQEEIDELRNWCASNVLLHTMEPYMGIVKTLEAALEDNVITREEFEDIKWACDRVSDDTESFGTGKHYDYITRGLQELQGVFHGILADGILSEEEVDRLRDWINDNSFLKSTYPYDEVESLIISILADGTVTQDELNMLAAFLTMFVDTKTSLHIHYQDPKTLKQLFNIEGICAVCPEVTINNKQFCFTGISKKAKRDDIADIIFDNGGRYVDCVSDDTDYLIYGAAGSPCWAYSCHGRKVEKAMQIRKKGGKVIIIHEYDFWDAVEDAAISYQADEPKLYGVSTARRTGYPLSEAVKFTESLLNDDSQIFLKDFLRELIYQKVDVQSFVSPSIDVNQLINTGVLIS